MEKHVHQGGNAVYVLGVWNPNANRLEKRKNEMISRLAAGGVACVLRRGGVTKKSAIFSLPVGHVNFGKILRFQNSAMRKASLRSSSLESSSKFTCSIDSVRIPHP